MTREHQHSSRRTLWSVILGTVLILTMGLTAPGSVASAADGAISIVGGDRALVPGDFGVLRIEAGDGAEIGTTRWDVDVNDVVELDAGTGRYDAIGTGTATVTARATTQDGQSLAASATITVSGGPAPIVEPVEALQDGKRPDFIMGADVSSLYQVMAAGKKYYDLDGAEAHLFDIMAAEGVNWVRLRVWNDPADPFGNPYGGGNSTVDTTIALAEQAKARGMKVNVVFHYSDFWAHPGQQRRPKAWADLTGEPLVAALSEFTTESLLKMREAGVYPEMVTIGNETNSNIVDVNLQLNAQGNMNPTAVEVFKAGSAAVRATDPFADDPGNRALVSFHLANGNNTSLYNNFTLALANNEVDYDALGASYYPSWHGTYEQVLNNLNTVSDRHGIFTYIAETAYPWTIREDAGDDTPQNFLHGDVSTHGVAASIQGQATSLRDVIDLAANINDERGLGVFWWEPAWLPGAANGWASPYGTGWEVANLFDVNGYALPSLRTFSLVRGEQDVPADAADWAHGWETTVAVTAGEALTMPTTVLAVRNDGRMGDTPRTLTRQPVVWNEADLAAVDPAVPGEYIVLGSVAGIPDNAFAHVVVRASGSDAAVAPSFSLPDGAEIAAADDELSYSARHLVDGRSYLELAAETANGRIDFTIDGADPRNGSGSTLELPGAPWVRASDSIRIYAGPIQIAQNVEVQAYTRRNGYTYSSGGWGSATTLLAGSPVVSRSYRAVYDYSTHLLANGGFEAGSLDGWELTGDATQAGVFAPEDYVAHAYAGDNSFRFTLDDGESMRLAQEVQVANGTYRLTLRARGDNQVDAGTQMALTAASGGEVHTSEVRTINVPGGRMIWREYSVDVEVTDGALGIAFEASSASAYQGYLDHVVLRPISVQPDPVVLEGIEITSPPANTTVVQGEALDLTGLVVTATFSDGSAQVVPQSELLVTGFDPLQLGQQTVTLTWTSDGVTRSASYPVTVEARPTTPPPSTPTPTLSPPTLTSPPMAPYEVPGFHLINDRWWYTTCEPYSQTIRCRTDIWSTQVRLDSGRWVGTTGWHFNNLTYLPHMTRAQWAGNPLGHAGAWTAADGRRWRTECDTAQTGRGGCRSFIWGQYVQSSQGTDGVWQYAQAEGWVFNNIVRMRGE